MKFCFYTGSVSPHQLPLARELVKRLGAENYRYVTQSRVSDARRNCGWHDEEEPWIVHDAERSPEVRGMLETCDVLMCAVRDFSLFTIRAQRGLPTLYVSERWFKPIRLHGVFNVSLPGWLRLLHPSYLKMACQIRRLLKSDAPFCYLPCGIHAAEDMARIVGWRRPTFPTRNPLAAYEKFKLWGYFVAPTSTIGGKAQKGQGPLDILWVGRMLDWKRVDTLVKAVGNLHRRRIDVRLTLVGDGPERIRLERLARDLPVSFLPPQPIDSIRTIMRKHDVYVLSSDAGEGWGAALNEALEEGMYVLGTCQAGASATLLDGRNLFLAGDWRRLTQLLMRCVKEKHDNTLKRGDIGEWALKKVTNRLLVLINDMYEREFNYACTTASLVANHFS